MHRGTAAVSECCIESRRSSSFLTNFFHNSQIDLRLDRELVQQLKREKKRPLLSPSDGQVIIEPKLASILLYFLCSNFSSLLQSLAREIGAARYLECSALTQRGLKASLINVVAVGAAREWIHYFRTCSWRP